MRVNAILALVVLTAISTFLLVIDLLSGPGYAVNVLFPLALFSFIALLSLDNKCTNEEATEWKRKLSAAGENFILFFKGATACMSTVPLPLP